MAKLTGVQTVDMVGGEITKIAYGGAEYAKVSDGKAKDGDLVTFPNDAFTRLKGNIVITGKAFYEITNLAVYFKNDMGDNCGIDSDNVRKAGGPTLFRKLPAKSPTTTDRLDSLETRVTALEDKEETEGNPEIKTVKRPAKVGEKIIITTAGPIKGQSYEVGAIFTVRRADAICKGDVYVNESPEYIDYMEYGVIVEPGPKFSVGDYVKVIGETVYGDIFEGTIVKVTKSSALNCEFRIDLLDGTDFDYVKAESLEKVSEEDAKKAEEHNEKVAKFAAIGRKVDEYKVGDIVEVIEGGRGVGNVGNLFKIESLFHNKYPVNIAGNVAYVGIAGDVVKLITPVERRFDK